MANKKRPSNSSGGSLSVASAKALRASGTVINEVWRPNPAQVRALQRLEFEVAYLGSRYGGKTTAGIIWLVQGNPDKPDYDANGHPLLVNQSYIHHPNFLGVVVRLNEKDLADWVSKAKPYYTDVLGGEYTKNPAEFSWPCGARIFLGHAQDTDAWTKYQGQNIVRFLVEEAGQIPDLGTFELLRSSVRSVYPEMRAQIFLTANPGGRGQQWIYDRYLEPKDRDGKPIKHPSLDRPILESDKGMIPIVEKVENPFTGEQIQITRIWVPSYLTDNPYAMKDSTYIANLATMTDDKQRRAFLFGDWSALRGTYFDIFRKETHTYNPSQRLLASWWKATGSLDWGFVHESAALWHKQDPETKQHLIFQEFWTSRTDPIELGAELARRSMPFLRMQGSLTFYVSHDLFHNKIGEFTWADLISKGVQKELGQGSCYLPDLVIKRLRDQYQIDGKEWPDGLDDRILTKEINGIVFRRAPSARAVGYMHMRTLMRVESLRMPTGAPDMAFAQNLLQTGTLSNYVAYLKSFSMDAEILPELLISTDCPRLIDAIPKCIHDPEDPETIDEHHFIGIDGIHSCRYLLGGIRDEKPSSPSKEMQVARMMEERTKRNPTLNTSDLIWIAREVEAEIEESQAADGGFSLGRSSRALRRMDQIADVERM